MGKQLVCGGDNISSQNVIFFYAFFSDRPILFFSGFTRYPLNQLSVAFRELVLKESLKLKPLKNQEYLKNHERLNL